MELSAIVIRVDNDRIYLSPKSSISIQQTNIPISHMTFRTQRNIFWKVELIHFMPTDKCLKVRVKEYNTFDISNFDSQHLDEEIDRLIFEKLDWKSLEPLLTSYQLSKLKEFVFNSDSGINSIIESPLPKAYKFFSNLSTPINSGNKGIRPTITTLPDEFLISFKDSHFISGYVTFKKFIKQLGQELDFQISNNYILEEFENVKSWFVRKLKIKKFKVSVLITLTDGKVTEKKATSNHIDQINPELIESIKYQRTYALIKEPKEANTSKSLYTCDDIFNSINSGDIEGNVFKQSEQDILDFFIGKSTTRNKNQLVYLSGKKQTENYKIRYTLNPNFGFLFLIEGAEKNHFVWELLNSHATYIWSIQSGGNKVESQFRTIETIINSIKSNGRENYKRTYKENYQDLDFVFMIITHDNITSEFVDDFPKWKEKLDKLVI
ncbi:MAG: hypothetical protein JNL22_01285 [Bacteroidales bacterium]|nr:hypothetical protein [Bacteroidales bacterium]